jgi:hypothetical protein
MSLDLTIIVPAYNEAHRLADGIKRFDDAAGDGAVDLAHTEVIVVDDGSTDATANTARSLLAHLPHHRVVSHAKNRGKGAAVRTGVGLATGAATAYMDADFAIDPRSVPQLLEGLRTSDVVIGSRALPESMVESSYALRSVMGNLFNRLVTVGTGLTFRDTQCGFKAFRTPVARLLFHLVRIDRFAFDVEILARAQRLGLHITEVPVYWRHVPGSTIHPLDDSVSMLADVYRSRLGLVPTPPVATAVVGRAAVGHAPVVGALETEVGAVVTETLGETPVPMISRPDSVTVLLPLVDQAGAAEVLSALQAEFGSLDVRRRASTPATLSELAPLAGRLEPTC